MASWFTADQTKVTRLCLLAACLLARSVVLAQEPNSVPTPGDSELRFTVRDELAGTTVSPFDNSTADLARRLAEVEARWQERDEADRTARGAASKKFSVRPFGRIHVDAATFSQDDANLATVGNALNGVDIRRARMGLEGEGFDTFFYRFDVDFVTFDSVTNTRPTIFDAYLDVQKLPVVGNIRAGHFREPFSLERLDSSHDNPFLERSNPLNALTPFRNIGVMAFDWNAAETRTWAYGVFHENTNEFGESQRDATALAFTGRTTWLPWYEEHEDGPHLWHVGASYSYRNLNSQVRGFDQTPEVVLKEGLLVTPNFVDTGLLELRDYHVAGVETATSRGPFSMQGEYVFLAGRQTDTSRVFFHGGYVEAMYWLTGEHRNYNRRTGIHGAVTPNCNFFCRQTDCGTECGRGAWEVAARVSYLNLNSGAVQGGSLTDLTLGLNWNYAVRSRVMFNYIHAFLDRGGLNSNADIFSTRLQFTF
jgi:phosphate-selective porin OprO/OprP